MIKNVFAIRNNMYMYIYMCMYNNQSFVSWQEEIFLPGSKCDGLPVLLFIDNIYIKDLVSESK